MTRVFVLGADGFLGTHAVGALTAAGATAVEAPPREEFDLGVVAADEVVALLRRARPDAVVNATGLVAGTPDELEQGNVGILRPLLAACATVAPGIRFVHLGSLAEYGPGGGWVEDGPAEPLSPYGRAKLAATRAVLDASRAGAVDGCVLRIANPVGRGQPAAGLVGAVLGQLRERPDGPVRLGPLDGCRDIVSARDVGRAVAAAALLASLDPDRRVINIGTGRPAPVRGVVHTLLRLAGSTGADVVESAAGGSVRSAAVLDAVPDVRRAADVLGWVAEDDVDDALRDALRPRDPLQRAS